MDLRPCLLQLLLGVGARPLQGFMRNAFPGKNNRGTHCVLLTHVALGMLHLRIYREGVRQYPILFL